jgi:uncharacterized protein YjbI with pentapeptide repeats
MKSENLQKVLQLHQLWRDGKSEGNKADLSGANLSGANLSRANLREADLSGADLSRANLSRANLYEANLSEADLSRANLSGANLRGADLSGADLSGANLSGANLSRADLSGAEIAKEPFPLEKDSKGFLVYKAIGNTDFEIPKRWKVEPKSYLEEEVNPNPSDLCGCGVNFSNTVEWCRRTYPNATVWKCRIEWQDAPSIVIPWNTDGKSRCGRLQLLKIVKATFPDSEES